ncbi:MAG TPA: ABC transporter permease [Mycobacteriales bacterium]|nr:ABC transporter permease [Mycobacteriales bacterium]
MLLVELRKLVGRPRTWVTVAMMLTLPTVVAVLIKVTGRAPRPGTGPSLLAEAFNNGTLFPAAALGIILPFLLPIAVAVVAGDAVAGEASAGTLRYLLVRPVSRTRLLVVKTVVLIVYVLATVLLVAAVSYVVGVQLFGSKPVSSISGGAPLSTTETALRILGAVLYIGWSMLALAAITLFFSTLTDSPLAAALGGLGVLVGSSTLFALDAAASIRPYIPTRYWLAFLDFFRNPILWRDIERGVALQAVYIAVFFALAWANFTTKDITS